MIERLKARYPNACISASPIPFKHLIWFWIREDEKYIGIEPHDLSAEETLLLKTVFPEYLEETALNQGTAAKWYNYLFLPGAPAPLEIEKKKCRIIQFSIAKDGLNIQLVQEAIKNMFVRDVTIVMIDRQQGLAIEEKNKTEVSIDDLQASMRAFENDFYMPISLYAGEFKPLEALKPFFQLEKQLFDFALLQMPKPGLFTLDSVLPVYLLEQLPPETRQLLFGTILEIFKKDREMWRTVKLYLENFSNASLTAKQLFIHRNSLQYRIEKFEEKSGLHLRNFNSAMLAYFACLVFRS
ncbi:PucR family transcriptional regulator [Heyndrickxia acidiproducens]|uniref:PucR family transcriptional regulator n=1 Tax=Heyndrickxia acidiproducens TaxID=1121084 RepID=UPI000364467A|nr:helix-turn-helix domain-containing protein [Heyndrickxia acidiproducens]